MVNAIVFYGCWFSTWLVCYFLWLLWEKPVFPFGLQTPSTGSIAISTQLIMVAIFHVFVLICRESGAVYSKELELRAKRFASA